jgi:hypothetical protein
MDPKELAGRRVVLCDQGDGWFSGLPSAVVGRVERVAPTPERGRLDDWSMDVSLVAYHGDPRPHWHEAKVTVKVDRVRLGVVDGTIPFAPSVPARLETPVQAGRATTAPGMSGGKITVFPAAHFGPLLEFVGAGSSGTLSEERVEMADSLDFEVPEDAPWFAADHRRVIRATREARTPMRLSGLGVRFALYRLDTEVAWELKGMPSVTRSPAAWRTSLALVRAESPVAAPNDHRDSQSDITVVPVIELRDLALLSPAATFPVARARVTRG